MKVVDYLDVTLKLNDGTYKPIRKPDDKTTLILTILRILSSNGKKDIIIIKRNIRPGQALLSRCIEARRTKVHSSILANNA